MLKQFVFSVVLGLSLSANAATTLAPAQQTEMVNAHNKLRQEVGVAPLKWSDSLATTAQNWADSLKANQACKMVHSKGTGLGENLYWASALRYSNGTSAVQAVTPTQATESWGKEKNDYTYATNTCAIGKVCGHYTQVVWKATSEVGCGKAVCADNTQVWVCNYSPQGNFVGQKPY